MFITLSYHHATLAHKYFNILESWRIYFPMHLSHLPLYFSIQTPYMYMYTNRFSGNRKMSSVQFKTKIGSELPPDASD